MSKKGPVLTMATAVTYAELDQSEEIAAPLRSHMNGAEPTPRDREPGVVALAKRAAAAGASTVAISHAIDAVDPRAALVELAVIAKSAPAAPPGCASICAAACCGLPLLVAVPLLRVEIDSRARALSTAVLAVATLGPVVLYYQRTVVRHWRKPLSKERLCSTLQSLVVWVALGLECFRLGRMFEMRAEEVDNMDVSWWCTESICQAECEQRLCTTSNSAACRSLKAPSCRSECAAEVARTEEGVGRGDVAVASLDNATATTIDADWESLATHVRYLGGCAFAASWLVVDRAVRYPRERNGRRELPSLLWQAAERGDTELKRPTLFVALPMGLLVAFIDLCILVDRDLARLCELGGGEAVDGRVHSFVGLVWLWCAVDVCCVGESNRKKRAGRYQQPNAAAEALAATDAALQQKFLEEEGGTAADDDDAEAEAERERYLRRHATALQEELTSISSSDLLVAVGAAGVSEEAVDAAIDGSGVGVGGGGSEGSPSGSGSRQRRSQGKAALVELLMERWRARWKEEAQQRSYSVKNIHLL